MTRKMIMTDAPILIKVRNPYQLIDRALIILDILDAFKRLRLCNDLIGLIDLIDLYPDRVGQRIFGKTVKQIGIIAPLDLKFIERRFFCQIIGARDYIHPTQGIEHLVSLFGSRFIQQIDLDRIKLLLGAFGDHIDVDNNK